MVTKYHVLVEPEATKRLARHIEFLARVSENAAARLYESYKKALEFLKTNPEACPHYIPTTPIDAELRYKLTVVVIFIDFLLSLRAKQSGRLQYRSHYT